MIKRLRRRLAVWLMPELNALVPATDLHGLDEIEVVIGRDCVWINGPAGNLFRATRCGRISFRWEG
jgi:hypothetical protein